MSARNELPPGWSIEEERYNDAPRFLLKDARGRLVEWQYDRGLLAAGSWKSLGITREELATMRAAQEFTRVVCELLGNEGSGMDISTDVLQDMLTAAGVTP
jgi:hypothetical protein